MTITNKDFNMLVDVAILITKMAAISSVLKLTVDFLGSLKYKEGL